MPTGKAADQPLVGITAPAVFQAGTGVVQGTLGIQYTKKLGEWTTGASIDTTFAFYESREDFRPARTYYGSIFASHGLTERIRARLSADLFYGTEDELRGSDIENTGSTTAFLKPSLIWSITDELSASVAVTLPVWRDVNEIGTAVGPLWSIGINRSF